MRKNSPQRLSRTFTLKNELGLHARAAALFAKTASKYQSKVRVHHGSQEANGKSIMEILTLGAGCDAEIQVTVQGPDALQALQSLDQLLGNRFGEK